MATVVTGSAGFLGRALVRRLCGAGERVIGIDRLPQAGRPGFTAITADLAAGDERVLTALAAADRVLHLAGRPSVRDRRPDVQVGRHRDNVLATAAVLAAVPARTPLVVTSSSSVYGGARSGRPCAETDALRPRGGYAESKVAAERLCAERLAAGGAVVIARPFTVAGEGQRPDMALAQWLEAARNGRPLRVLGSELRSRDITDVEHAVRALVDLSECGVRGVVNVGSGAGHTLREMADAVARALDVEVRLAVEPADDVEVRDTLADTTALRAAIGWVPRTDLPSLVARQTAASRPLEAATAP